MGGTGDGPVEEGIVDPTRSNGENTTSWVAEVRTDSWIAESVNIEWDRDDFFHMQNKKMNHLSDIECDYYTNFYKPNSRTVQEYDGWVFVSYVRTGYAHIAYTQYWLQVSQDGGNTWEDPLLVHNSTNSQGGKTDLLVHNDKIFFMTMENSIISDGIRLSVRMVPFMSWTDLDDATPHTFTIGYYYYEFSLVGLENGVISFWKPNYDAPPRYSLYSNGTWSALSSLPGTGFTFSPVVYSDGIVERVFVFLRNSGDELRYIVSDDGGRSWSSSTLLYTVTNGFNLISATSSDGRIDAAITTQGPNSISYFSYNGTAFSPLKMVTLNNLNNLDDMKREVSIGGTGDGVWITYENVSGTCSYIYSLDNGQGFSSAVNIGDGSSHCPLMDRDGKYLSLINGTKMELYSFQRSNFARIRTTPISPVGLERWVDFGIEIDGVGSGGEVRLRILKADYVGQLFPEVGFLSVTALSVGTVENRDYNYVGEFDGDWSWGDSLVGSIVVELEFDREPQEDPRLYSMCVNYSCSYPYREDFRDGGHLIDLDGTEVTEIGLELEVGLDQGSAVLGPIESEGGFPEHLSAYASSVNYENNIRFEVLDRFKDPIPGFTLIESVPVSDPDVTTYVTWDGKDIGEIPATLERYYLKVYIARTSTLFPKLRWLSLEDSTPPEVVSFDIEDADIYRGEQTRLVFTLEDVESPVETLGVEVQYMDPATGLWEGVLLSHPMFDGSSWILYFEPGYDCSPGEYILRARPFDKFGKSSGFMELETSITVRNNRPTAPALRILPELPRKGDIIDLELLSPGWDRETGTDGLFYNIRYHLSGGDLHEILNVTSPEMELTDVELIKGQVWHVEVRTWDGLSESPPYLASLNVGNCPPQIDDPPGDIVVGEDTLSEPFVYETWFSDDDGDPLSYMFRSSEHIEVVHQGYSFNIKGSPDFNGDGFVLITAGDGDESVSLNISVSILPVNDIPIYGGIRPIQAFEDRWTEIPIWARDDSDGERVEVTTDLPEVLSDLRRGVDYVMFPNGTLRIRPTNEVVGTHNITVTITDGTYLIEESLVLEVVNMNDAPHVEGIDTNPQSTIFREGETVSFTGVFSDPDTPYGDELHLRWTSSINGDLGNTSEVSAVLLPGQHTITLVVEDSEGQRSIKSITLTVLETEEGGEEKIRSWLLYLLVAAGALMIGVLLGLLMVLIFRKKKEDQGGEVEDKGPEPVPPLYPGEDNSGYLPAPLQTQPQAGQALQALPPAAAEASQAPPEQADRPSPVPPQPQRVYGNTGLYSVQGQPAAPQVQTQFQDPRQGVYPGGENAGAAYPDNGRSAQNPFPQGGDIGVQ